MKRGKTKSQSPEKQLSCEIYKCMGKEGGGGAQEHVPSARLQVMCDFAGDSVQRVLKTEGKFFAGKVDW